MRKTKGFTLIELMIAMVLGLFVIAVVIITYSMTVSGSSATIKSARLNHDLGLAMTLIVNDIKRSGYWGGATSNADASTNPFMDATQRPAFYNPVGGLATCVVYSYDADGDETVDTDEYYGFRLNSGTIQMRLTGTTNANCTDGNWTSGEIVDGDEINVTNLTFTPTYSCLNVTTPASTIQATTTECSTVSDSVIELRQVSVSLTAQLVDDTAVSKTVTEIVMFRNNRIL